MVDERTRDEGQREPAIDLLRAASIVWVVGFWHLIDYGAALPDHKNPVTMRITVVVLAVFVMVSGYLLGRSRVTLSAPSLRRFYAARLIRIYPPFVAAAGLFAALGIASDGSLIQALLLVAMVSGAAPYTLWFIAMIGLFYAATPLLLAVRGETLRFALIVAGATAVLGVLSRATALDPRLALYLPAYAAGLWLARDGRPRLPVRWLAGATAAGAAASLAAVAPEASLAAIPLALTGAALVFAVAQRWQHHLPAAGTALTLSGASYFMFLFHRPLYELALRAWTPDTAAAQAAYLWLVALPLVVVLSTVGQRLYDRAWHGLRRAATSMPAVAR